MSMSSFSGFGSLTRFGGGVPGAGLRIRSANRPRTGTICATGVSRSSTAIVSPFLTARRYSLRRDLSSAIRRSSLFNYDQN